MELNFKRSRINEHKLSHQIEVKVEDITKRLPYADNYFDYIYARLILHYLPKPDLQIALRELNRILKKAEEYLLLLDQLIAMKQKVKIQNLIQCQE